MSRFISCAALGAILLLLIACSSQEPAASSNTPSPQAESSPAPDDTPTPQAGPATAPEDTPSPQAEATSAPADEDTPTPATPATQDDDRFGGTLRVVSVGSVQSFDPLWTTASATANVSNTILEGLVVYTEGYGLGNLLLDSWETSNDSLTWTFRIRDNVTLHDGTPLTAEQVIGTLNRQKEAAPLLNLLWSEFGPPEFEDFIQQEDDLTFTVNLQEPTGLVVNSLGPQNFAPQIVTEEWYNTPQTESASGSPIGTGPYKFESWAPGDRWIAVRYEGYTPNPEPSNGLAGEKVAYVDRVEYIEIPDQTTRVAALEVGEVDLTQEFPPDLLPRLEANPDIALYDNPPSRLLGHFNHLKPPFNVKEARKALVMAYDNERALLAAVGDPSFMNLCPSLLQCGTQWETDAGSDDLYNAQRMDEARQIIQDLGLAGTRVRLMDPQDRQPAHGAAQVSREVLEDLGFEVEHQSMDWATMVSRRADPELWEFFHTWSGIGVRASPVGHLLFGELQYDAWFNHYQDVDGTQRDIFSRLVRATSDEEMMQLNEEFQEYFYEDAIFLQIGEFFSKWAGSTRVQGWADTSVNPAGQHPYNKWIVE